MSTEPSRPGGDELAPEEVLRLYGMGPHSAKNLIAKIKADALREAATEFEARLPGGTGNGRAYNSYRVAEMLSARADRIEGEK